MIVMTSSADLAKPLTSAQANEFAELCRDTKSGFTDALDLVLIHNERDARGPQPRSTLNPLTVLLALPHGSGLLSMYGHLPHDSGKTPVTNDKTTAMRI
ncbi:hypothetical protein [Saccharopolyspora pogona]|uniref:hypothetical protein n=1 Tax=Saccharopolyspora pogona TaxID=333966 RepID=UPI001688BBE9|nr:hypothetical protein [Saccharopolyspora pogona]